MSNESKIPDNHVVGIISGDGPAGDAVKHLHREGFDEVLVMHHVDSAGEGARPLSALIERLTGHLSEQTGYLDQYQQATDRGDIVLAVAANPEDADRVRAILESEGALNLRFFGRLAVTDMTPETNPSVPSDQVPRAPHGPENS